MAFEKEQIEKMGITYKEGMTDEEVYSALAELKGKADKYDPLKTSFDKTASELAGYKKKEKEGLSEAEKQQGRITELEGKVAEYEKKALVRDIRDAYKAQGYDDDTADKISQAQAEGDFKKVSELQTAFMKKHDEELKAQILKDTPTIKQGDPNDVAVPKSIEEFKKMKYSDMLVLQEKHPDIYKKFAEQK